MTAVRRVNPLDLLDAPAEAQSGVMATLAPELPFDEIWTPEPDANLVIPALGIAPGPTHLVTGSWYTGKTLLLATMGLCVASGRDLFGLYGVKRGKWIHFDHEMGRRHIKRYMQRLRGGLDIDVEELRDRVSLRVLPQLNLCHEKAVDHYTDLLEGCALATIDPLRAAAPEGDENDSDFRRYLDMLSTVSDRTGCSIEVLHHGGKPVQGAERRNTGRGTSAIDDASQSKFVLTAKEKGAPMLVSHEKTRELTTVLGSFYLEIQNTETGVRLVHRDLEEMAEYEAESAKRKEDSQLERIKGRIRAALATIAGQFTGKREAFLELVGGDRTLTSVAVTKMIALGELLSEGRGELRTWSLGTNRYSV